jgi:hypothetical protein
VDLLYQGRSSSLTKLTAPERHTWAVRQEGDTHLDSQVALTCKLSSFNKQRLRTEHLSSHCRWRFAKVRPVNSVCLLKCRLLRCQARESLVV